MNNDDVTWYVKAFYLMTGVVIGTIVWLIFSTWIAAHPEWLQ